ncbi:hypothetical protein PTSG_12384 [Salpingoeca rosetta]|uniref:Glycosyl hydrolases family 39 N-terminal catalytic domain-containing protein n=1 Tax=Salpingoeca rosetta (strain ATCC 50818 / BSB-021) TaxID=946362 RepID=F2UDI0_SALR5|nr:uncharacterized protein PTSG_12384 [Salpingoeca rosetta]EGD74675.1 hypothetical protein PTSG_12384 [Salpingoeca rosetta]|eukprot:XP_004992932.1 hypothetical protein PTSG_12384 [Salpingoeca rosetta]
MAPQQAGLALVLVALAAAAAAEVIQDATTTATVHLGDVSPFNHVWKECVGSGHALLGTRADWRAHLQNVTRDLGFKRVRFHGILDDDMTSVYDGKPSFYNVFQVYDFMLRNGVRPVVELSFMPRSFFSCNPSVNCTYAFGNPVGGYKVRMEDLNPLCRHHIITYSMHTLLLACLLACLLVCLLAYTVEMWGIAYPFPYLNLYNATATALKSVHPSLKVGGPATMQVQHVADFIHNTSARGIPVDFVSTHLYPSDPNCNLPSTRNDPDCFAHTLQSTQKIAAAAHLPLLITEYNDGLEGTPPHRDTAYAAAFVFHNVPLVQNLSLFSWWTFTDVFEEGGMNPSPFSNAFGLQNIYGVAKPVYRAFQLLNDAGRFALRTTVTQPSSQPPTGQVRVFATINSTASAPVHEKLQSLRVHVSNFLRLDMGECGNNTATITIPTTSPPPASLSARVYALDDWSVNPRAEWTRLGSPVYPTQQQLNRIFAASEVTPSAQELKITKEAVSFTTHLRGCSAYLVTFHVQ